MIDSGPQGNSILVQTIVSDKETVITGTEGHAELISGGYEINNYLT